MRPTIFYLRTEGRRPISPGIRPPLSDIQKEIPKNWCDNCGKEIYAPHGCLCRRCAAERSLKI